MLHREKIFMEKERIKPSIAKEACVGGKEFKKVGFWNYFHEHQHFIDYPKTDF